MHRKDFLKKAGVGTIALASLPALTDVASAADGGTTRFHFVSLSGTGATIPESEDAIIMTGAGRFGGGDVRGGGDFTHFDATKIPSPDFKATGQWKAAHFVSFTEIGTFGVIVAGILVMRAILHPCDGASVPGDLRVVCNVGPAGLMTGEPEGFFLTVPGLPTFNPLLGLTNFDRNCNQHEDGE